MARILDAVAALVATVVFRPAVRQRDQDLCPRVRQVQQVPKMPDRDAHSRIALRPNSADAFAHGIGVGLVETFDPVDFATLVRPAGEAVDRVAIAECLERLAQQDQ